MIRPSSLPKPRFCLGGQSSHHGEDGLHIQGPGPLPWLVLDLERHVAWSSTIYPCGQSWPFLTSRKVSPVLAGECPKLGSSKLLPTPSMRSHLLCLFNAYVFFELNLYLNLDL